MIGYNLLFPCKVVKKERKKVNKFSHEQKAEEKQREISIIEIYEG